MKLGGLELRAISSVRDLDPKSQQVLIEEYLRFNKEAIIEDNWLYAGGISIEAHNLDTGQKERIEYKGDVVIPGLYSLCSTIAKHEGVERNTDLRFITDPAVVIPRKEGGYIVITYSEERHHMDIKEIKDVYITSQLNGDTLIKRTTGCGRFTKGTGRFEKHYPENTSDIYNFVLLSSPGSLY